MGKISHQNNIVATETKIKILRPSRKIPEIYNLKCFSKRELEEFTKPLYKIEGKVKGRLIDIELDNRFGEKNPHGISIFKIPFYFTGLSESEFPNVDFIIFGN